MSANETPGTLSGQQAGMSASHKLEAESSTLTDAKKKAYIDAELCLQSSAAKSGIENTQPYWDEQADYAAIEAGSMTLAESVVFDQGTGFGGNDTGSDQCVADGPFADLELHISQTGYAVDYCLSRDLSQSNFLKQANTSYVDTCFASANYSEAWTCYKSNPHGAGHSGVGGTVSLLPFLRCVTLSPGDSLFYLHHTFLDYLWWQWQAVDFSIRLTDMTGRNVPLVEYLLVDEDYIFPIAVLLEDNGDPGNVSTLNHNLWMAGLIPNATIAKVTDIPGGLICAEYV
ncbi:hypothetical protein diail_7164 [Diaporthe ilicicola]|nr:hypothetical protein diail_7164 [Diaporthe ilicicola]